MNNISKPSYYEESKIMYNYLLKIYPNLDEKIYQEILNVPVEKINKKIRSPFRKDTHPSFQFRYVTMEDSFANINNKPIIRDVLCSVDYGGWSFKTGTYAIPLTLVAWYYNLYIDGKIDFNKIVLLLYKKFNIPCNIRNIKIDLEKLEKKEPYIYNVNTSVIKESKDLIVFNEDKIHPDEFSEKDLDYWLSQCNANKELLIEAEIYKAKKVWHGHSTYYNDNIIEDPCYVYTSQLGKIKCYRPFNKKRKWLSKHTNKDICLSNFLPIFNKFTKYNKSSILVIQKAVKESLLFYSLYDDLEMDSITINSESTFLDKNIFTKLCHFYGKENIYYIGDSDTQGIKACEKIKKQYDINTLYISNFKNTTDYWNHLLQTNTIEDSKKIIIAYIKNLLKKKTIFKSTTISKLEKKILNYTDG